MWLKNKNYINQTYLIDEEQLKSEHPEKLYQMIKTTFDKSIEQLIEALRQYKGFDTRKTMMKLNFAMDWSIWIAKINRCLVQQGRLNDLSLYLIQLIEYVLIYSRQLNLIVLKIHYHNLNKIIHSCNKRLMETNIEKFIKTNKEKQHGN